MRDNNECTLKKSITILDSNATKTEQANVCESRLIVNVVRIRRRGLIVKVVISSKQL